MKKTLIVLMLMLFAVNCFALELVRQKNVATVIVFPLIDSTTTTALQSGATALNSEIDQWSDSADNPDGFAACTNEATEIGTDGQYYLVLTQAEMNDDYIVVQIKASDALTQVILIRTIVGDPLLVATTDDGGTINVTAGAIDNVDLVDLATTTTTATATTTVNGLAVNVITAASTNADFLTEIETECDEALTDIKLDHLLNIAVDTNYATTVHADSVVGHMTTSSATADYVRTTDSLEDLGENIVAIVECDIVGHLGTIIDYVDGLETRLTAARAGYLDELAAANLPTDIANVKAETALIVADTSELQTDDYPTSIAAVQTQADAIKAETVLIVADTGELQTDDYPTSIAAIKAETVLIVADTGELQTNQGAWATATSVNLEDDAITAAKITNAAWQELIELFFSFDATGAYGDQPGSVVDQIADNAGSGSAPTVEQIRIEIDSNSTQFSAIVEDTGTTLPGLISAIGGGDGSVVVDHDYGGADALAYKTEGGAGIDNGVIRAYLKSDYDAGSKGSAYIKATTRTDVNGQWTSEMNLDPETYTLYYFKQGAYSPSTQEVTVE